MTLLRKRAMRRGTESPDSHKSTSSPPPRRVTDARDRASVRSEPRVVKGALMPAFEIEQLAVFFDGETVCHARDIVAHHPRPLGLVAGLGARVPGGRQDVGLLHVEAEQVAQ